MNKWPQSYSELVSFPSHCQSKQRSIVSEEKGLKHIALNVDNNKVRQIKIDGDLWTKGTDTIRADYLVLNEDKKVAYIIELKRSDIEHAIKQLEITDNSLSLALSGFKKCWRLVYRTRTKKLKNRDENNFQRKYPKLVVKKNYLEEEI